MGETTILTQAAPKKASLRTTVPMSVVRQFDLKPGDMLEWFFEAKGGEMFLIVRPTKKSVYSPETLDFIYPPLVHGKEE